ncbi:coiled-coil protein, partial [Sulfuracidifex metallicus]|uniref:coiled-coil protein n=1 Tax=Sulfuracidifex metallicus TaxID=47303 RepID=UPI002276D9D2
MSNPPAEATEESIYKKISDVRNEISTLREKRYASIEEIRKLRQKKSEKIEKLKAVRLQLKTVFEEYNSRINELKELKQKKEQLFEVIKEMRKEFEELRNLMKKTQGLNPDILEKRIKSLEWRIQTSSLTLEEEKKLIQRIADMERRLNEAKKILKVKEKGNEERAEFLAKRIELATIRQKISSLISEISEKRKTLKSLRDERDKLTKELDELSSQIEAKSKEIDDLGKQIEAKSKELDELIKARKALEQGVTTSRANIAEIMEKRKKVAEEKLKKGERLSFDEIYA